MKSKELPESCGNPALLLIALIHYILPPQHLKILCFHQQMATSQLTSHPVHTGNFKSIVLKFSRESAHTHNGLEISGSRTTFCVPHNAPANNHLTITWMPTCAYDDLYSVKPIAPMQRENCCESRPKEADSVGQCGDQRVQYGQCHGSVLASMWVGLGEDQLVALVVQDLVLGSCQNC